MSWTSVKRVAHHTAIRQAGLRLLHLVFPPTCAACGEALDLDERDLCADCGVDLAQSVAGAYCRTCGDQRNPYLLLDGCCTQCRTARPRFAGFVRVGLYQDPIKSLILRFKRRQVLDRFLGRLMADAMEGRLDPTSIDYWVPIPSHWRRRLQRGFQPTELLAQAAAARWRGRVEPILKAARYVPPFHHKMSMTERKAAIKGAFSLGPGIRLDGKTIVLIDDVTTSGATLAEAARTLRPAKPALIFAVVLAKVGDGLPSPQA